MVVLYRCEDYMVLFVRGLHGRIVHRSSSRVDRALHVKLSTDLYPESTELQHRAYSLYPESTELHS